LTTSQVQQGLTTAQVVALSTAQVQALTTSQVVALSTTQFAAMETRDIAALTTTQVMAMTSSQVAALTTDQISVLALASPIVLDLNGDGVSTQSVSKGVAFDVFGVGQKVNTGWVTGGDGLLVMDRNRDGLINGGGELFGVGTVLQNGQRAGDGYIALSELDANADGLITGADAGFSDLMAWVDKDSDGVSDDGELQSLGSLGITELNLQAQASRDVDNGNVLGLKSSYSTADGGVHEMADVWFATDGVANGLTADPLTQQPQEAIELILPPPAGGTELAAAPFSTAGRLDVNTSLPPTDTEVRTYDADTVSTNDLRSQVGGLVDALAAYGAGGTQSPSTQPAADALVSSSTSSSQSVTGNSGLVGMVDALKQFDANGQPVTGSTMLVPGTNSLSLNGYTQNKKDVDILASSK
jgi:hypothetical protein